MKKVNPKVAVISAGKDNEYGHPHEETLDRLKSQNIDIYGTWLSGDIVIRTNGTTYGINTNEKVSEAATIPAIQIAEVTEEDTTSTNHNSNVIIENIDLVDEIVKIKNTGSTDVDISGWKVLSVTGNQTYTIPNGTTIKAGSTITIFSGKKATGDLKWSGAYIWNNEGDLGVLYDDKGNEVSRFE